MKDTSIYVTTIVGRADGGNTITKTIASGSTTENAALGSALKTYQHEHPNSDVAGFSTYDIGRDLIDKVAGVKRLREALREVNSAIVGAAAFPGVEGINLDWLYETINAALEDRRPNYKGCRVYFLKPAKPETPERCDCVCCGHFDA